MLWQLCHCMSQGTGRNVTLGGNPLLEETVGKTVFGLQGNWRRKVVREKILATWLCSFSIYTSSFCYTVVKFTYQLLHWLYSAASFSVYMSSLCSLILLLRSLTNFLVASMSAHASWEVDLHVMFNLDYDYTSRQHKCCCLGFLCMCLPLQDTVESISWCRHLQFSVSRYLKWVG